MNYESAKLPDIKFFDVDAMNEEDRQCCERWHHEESSRMKLQGSLYNLHSEMLSIVMMIVSCCLPLLPILMSL